MYARPDCIMNTELACADALAGGADPEIIAVTAPKGGSFFAYVDGSSFDGMPHAAAYTLTGKLIQQVEVEPNDDGPMPGPTTATSVNIATLPALVTGSIDKTTDPDEWFSIDTTALGTKTISAESIGYGADICAPAGAIDTVIEIVDAAGTQLASNDDVSGFTNWCSLAVADMAPGGIYIHVTVSDFCDPASSDCSFQYGVKISVE